MKKLFIALALLLGLSSSTAQSFVGRLNLNLYDAPKLLTERDTLKILAVMVEFQKDNDPNTFGNGKFGSVYSKDYGDTIIDPLPHDANYFADHLEFAKNYYQKVSGGKVNISYKVLPQIITVSKIIREYSLPIKNSKDLTNLGKFAQEVWHLVNSVYPDIDFSKYDLFTVFHAGVGGDIKLDASSVNDRDLPSIYLGTKTLTNIFGYNFTGFPVNNGKFFIKNTMILPCTESREQDMIGGKVLWQFSINGILAANIASHLGLPDLFNTETGTTAIGRLGLMDGDSFFAYNGVFPPEPSPWEKIYLGWVKPVTLSIEDKKVNLAAKLAASLNDTTILKIPINPSEYFLVENRQRDSKKDGVIITYKVKGVTEVIRFNKDTTRFNYINVEALRGVITDVDEFDWAVPGNGILIWHIDENVIKEKIADNKINAEIKRRGVDVEEADGIQDIGTEYFDVLSQSYLSRGASEEDFWHAGNKTRYYKNRFAPDTKPNTNSNSGANSLISIENFSPSSNRMNFRVSFNYASIKLLSTSKLDFLIKPAAIQTLHEGVQTKIFYAVDNGRLLQFDHKMTLLNSYDNFSDKNLALFYFSPYEYVVGSTGKKLNILRRRLDMQREETKSFSLPAEISSQIVISGSSVGPKILAGLSDGQIVNSDIETLWQTNQIAGSSYFKAASEPITQIAANYFYDGFYSFITSKSFYTAHGGSYNFPMKTKKLVLTKNQAGNNISIVLTEENNFYIFDSGGLISNFTIKSKDAAGSFSMADLKNDKMNYIILNNGIAVEAYNIHGKLAENFPFVDLGGVKFKGTPVSADLNLDGAADVISFSENGNVYAIDGKTGKILANYPLSAGTLGAVTPSFYKIQIDPNKNEDQFLALGLVDSNNNFYSWAVSKPTSSVSWSSEYGGSANNSFIKSSSSVNEIRDFFPAEKAYNWPNPVYSNATNIRYYVSEDSNVKIKIFDLAGALVDELDGRGRGGFDNEVIWDVSKIQSGVYYAQIDVRSENGKSANKIIKIAVIK